MRPPLWHPPVDLSTAEHAIIKRIRRAKLFVFLRQQHRHTLFADPVQQELLTLYKDQPQGHPPVPPAQLALATLLQAYTRSCPSSVRLNTRGLPGHGHRGKKALPIGPSWRHSGSLSRDTTLDAGRVDAPRRLKPSPLTASPSHSMLTPLLAAAMVARETAAPRAASRRDPSGRRLWRMSVAASAWPSLCRASAPAGAAGGVS